MIFQLSDWLLLNFEFHEITFRCEYKDISLKFFLKTGLVIANFDSVLRKANSPRASHSDSIERDCSVEDDILKLVDGSIYEHFSDDSLVEIHRIIYFLSIYSFILICEHLAKDYLYHQSFKECLFFFFIMKENDYHAHGRDWPLFEQTQYEDIHMSEKEVTSSVLLRQYGDKLRKYAHINSVYSNEDFASIKNEICLFYFETMLGFCTKGSKFQVWPDMIDPFLYGVFKQKNPGFCVSYAVFNRYMSHVKQVQKKVRRITTSCFEKKIYRFYLSFYISFFNQYSDSLSHFLNNIVESNIRLQNDYANAVIITLLELNYFASLLELSFNQKCEFLNIYFKSPINLISHFNVFHWNDLYLGKTQNFLYGAPQIGLKTIKEVVKYDAGIIDLMKFRLVEHLATFSIIDEDRNFYREIIVRSKNEFDLLNNLYQAMKKKMVLKNKHIFLIMFFSVLNHLKNIFMIKLNNIYVACIKRYRSHSLWYRHIYDVAKLTDPTFKLQKKDLLDNFDSNLFTDQNIEASSDNLHYLFQTSLCIFFMLQKYYFNVTKKCDLSISSIYKLHLIDFDFYAEYMTYSQMIYILFDNISALTPRKKSRRKLKKPQMNLSNLLNKKWQRFFYYKNELSNTSPSVQQKHLFSLRRHLKKIESKR